MYVSVKQALTEAINNGHYQPGVRMPSTKELSRQMSVSLVTAHRALQDLVTVGLLERTRGRGTYVVENHRDIRPRLRVGVVINQGASLAEFCHSQILEGMHRAAVESRVDLLLLGFDDVVRQDVQAYVMISPMTQELDNLLETVGGKAPLVVVGARSDHAGVTSIDTDNADLAEQAVNHLYHLGHRRVGCVVGGRDSGNSRNRCEGFIQACKSLGIPERDRSIIEVDGWQLRPNDKLKLNRMLSEEGLTAVFAGGYYLALDVYQSASTLGLKVPDDLTVVGVDDPHSAAHLRPSLTTLRQPLTHLGHAAVTGISKYFNEDNHKLRSEILRAELVIRRSSGAPRITD